MDKTVILIKWSKMATSTYSSKVEVQLLPHQKKKKKKEIGRSLAFHWIRWLNIGEIIKKNANINYDYSTTY